MISLSDILPLNVADIWFPASHPLAGQQGVVQAFIIRHADGPILYDTGMGTGQPLIEELYRPVVRNLEEALADKGFRTEEIVAVANSHLHFDHCGGNRFFPGVPIYVQAADYKMAHETTFTILEWVNAPGVGYLQISGEAEIAPGVRVIPTPGHTPGHQSMCVDTSDGLAVLVGQAMYSVREYEHVLRTGTLLPGDDPPDPDAYLASAQRLIEMRARRVYFSHDTAVWDRR